MSNTNYLSLVLISVVTTSLFAQSRGGGRDIIDIDGGRTVILNDRSLIDDTDGQIQAFPVSQNRKWIGVVCGPVEDVLRAHIELPDGVGIVIQQVLPDSPAEAIGLKQHDVLTNIGNRSAKSVNDLVEAIGALKDDGKLTLEWLRKGKVMSATVTPMDRPDSVAFRWEVTPDGDVTNDVSRIRKWLGQLEDGQWKGVPSKLRVFGPGIPAAGDMPTNLKINIQKNGNEAAKITVERNDDRWEVTEDNLDQLPKEIRPHVESMLGGKGVVFGFGGPGEVDRLELDQPWPRMEQRLDEMRRHMEEMHQQLQDLHQQKSHNLPKDGDDYDPNNDASLTQFRFHKVA